MLQRLQNEQKYSNSESRKLRKCWDLHLHPFAGILNTLAIKRKFKRKLFNATSAELPFPWYSANKKLDVGIMETRQKHFFYFFVFLQIKTTEIIERLFEEEYSK